MDVNVLIAQINAGNRFNFAAISGGRIVRLNDKSVRLPVGNGYAVEIELAGHDTYTVCRTFTRKRRGELVPTRYVKGERTEVYADQVGNVAYYASCYRSYDETEWMHK